MLCEIVYELIYGHTPSKSYFYGLIKQSTKSTSERIVRKIYTKNQEANSPRLRIHR
jgi:hypothetical protein